MNLPYNCIVVLGPTASRKTQLACTIAHVFNGEVISADSRQVYKKLNIGSGKDLDSYHVNGESIPYHLIDICEPDRQFYLHDFVRALRRAFDDIVSRGKLPVICGGTGLYLDALRLPFGLTQVPPNDGLREDLNALSKQELLDRLFSYPEMLTTHVDRTSRKRIIRGIEVAEYGLRHELDAVEPGPYRPYYIGIALQRKLLLHNIEDRLKARLDNGMVEEVRALLKDGIGSERLMELGLEYKYLALFLDGKISKAELQNLLFIAIRQFAKRQMTWFRRMERQGVKIHWLDAPVLSDELRQTLMELFPV